MGLLNFAALSETVMLAIHYYFLSATTVLQPFPCRKSPRSHLCRFQNHVRVLDSIASPDQANRQRDALFELRVRLKSYRNRTEALLKALHGMQIIGTAEFLRHHNFPDYKISLNCPENLQNTRHIVNQGNIHGFNLRPVRKPSVGDNQRVRVTRAAQQ